MGEKEGRESGGRREGDRRREGERRKEGGMEKGGRDGERREGGRKEGGGRKEEGGRKGERREGGVMSIKRPQVLMSLELYSCHHGFRLHSARYSNTVFKFQLSFTLSKIAGSLYSTIQEECYPQEQPLVKCQEGMNRENNQKPPGT